MQVKIVEFLDVSTKACYLHHNLCLTYLLTTDRCIWPSLFCWLFLLIIQVDCELGPMCVSLMWCSLYWIFRADLHYVTFLFCHRTSPFSKIFSHVNKQRCSHWQECLHHISVLFRRCCWARIFDMMEWVQTGLYLLVSDNVNSLTSLLPHFKCLLAMSSACLSSEMDET